MECRNVPAQTAGRGSYGTQTDPASLSAGTVDGGSLQETCDSLRAHGASRCWFAISTKPHQERIAERTLQRLRIETFCPLLRERKWIRRRQEVKTSPLFPGYLFARFSLAEAYRAVVYARGVKSIVRFGHDPAVVDEALIHGLKARLDEGCLTIPTTSFRPGQIVRIANGTLNGLEAVFERELTGSQRAILLLKALAFNARVVVELEQIVDLQAV
jgi:transcriptional antiterminator RfaH